MQRTIPPPPKTQGSSLLEDPFLGMEIGALRIIELIGEGGFGAVYKAFDLHTHTHQAIKILRVNRNAHLKQAIHERFQREAHILQQLDHPYIVRSGEFGQIADGVFYLVMEYLQGESFHERRLRLQQIPPSDLLRWLPQLGSALHYIHQREIIHRDLKPENLFLHRASPQSEEVLKLLDFGIASIAAESSITQTGKAFGSPLYMSPEQVKGEGKRATAQTDIYSLGVILYEALTGIPPFQGEGPAIMFAHIMTPPPRLSVLCPNIPWNDSLERSLQRALAKEPEERWPNIHAMLQPILAGLQELSQALSQQTSGDLSRITAPQRGLSAFGQTPPVSSQEIVYQDDDHHQTTAMTPIGLSHLSITSDPFAQDEATIAKPSARIVSFDHLPAAKHLTSTQEEIEVAFIEQDEILDLDTAHLDFELPSAHAPTTPLPHNQTPFSSPVSPQIPPPPPSIHPSNRPPLPTASTSPQIPPPPPHSARPSTPPLSAASKSPQSPPSPPPHARPLPPHSLAHPSASIPHPTAPTNTVPPLSLPSDASSAPAKSAVSGSLSSGNLSSGNLSSGRLSPIAPSRSTALPWLLLVMGLLLLLFGMIRLFFSNDIHRAEQVLPEKNAPQTTPPLSHRPNPPALSPPTQHPQQHIAPQQPNLVQRPNPLQRSISPVDSKGSTQKILNKVGKKKTFRKRKKKLRPKKRKKDPRNLFEFEPELSP